MNSIEDALRMTINLGYQDVDPVTLERTFDKGGEQALLWHSPLTPSQRVEARQTIINELIDDVQGNLLNPQAWVPTFAGQPALNAALNALIANRIAVAVATLVNQGVDAAQAVFDRFHDQMQTTFKPVLDAAGSVSAGVEGGIDGLLLRQNSSAARSAEPSATSFLARGVDSAAGIDKEPAAVTGGDTKQDVAQRYSRTKRDFLENGTLAQNARATAQALREQRQATRAELAQTRVQLRTRIDRAGDAVGRAVDDVKTRIDTAGDSLKQSVEKAQQKATGRAVSRGAPRHLAAAS